MVKGKRGLYIYILQQQTWRKVFKSASVLSIEYIDLIQLKPMVVIFGHIGYKLPVKW